MEIRRADKKDVEHIIAMLADDALGNKRENYKTPIPNDYLDAFEKIDKDPNQLLVVVEEKEEIIGTAQLTFIQYLTYQGGMRAQIEAVRIKSSCRRAGLGETLFKWLIQTAQDRGVHVVQLTTDKTRPDALRFYEKLGFKATHEGMKMHF